MIPVYCQRIIALQYRVAKALAIAPQRIIRFEEWANCLFIVIQSAHSSMKRLARFVSYKAIQNIPADSGEYLMIESVDSREGKRTIQVEVDLVSSGDGELASFVVRSIEESPRIWQFDAFRGKLTRGFDWEGNLIPRSVLRCIGFAPAPDTSVWVDDILAGRNKACVRNEYGY
jgi:hypothetical protein